VLGESRRATGNNIARERLFSERVAELMNRYANEQLTTAQAIAELIEMAKDIRAKLRSSIKRLLVRHGYPPDQQPAAIKLVIEQMEQLAPHYADGDR